ncbi:helix-turn-helix domain-containing protein [Clostridium neonatale]|uniref:helix-turn-helix domain-containing protein n=1 Tax=Clostridium neonatale TaxID=137838 RepID=UPI003977E557
MTISDRIYTLRNNLNLSQEAFGSKIGVTKYSISSYEKGKNAVKDRVVTDICREFNVNEEWLRNGTGEMFIETPESTLNQLASEFNFSNIEYEMLYKYLKLSPSDRNDISIYIDSIINAKSLKKELTTTKEKNSNDDIEKELENYRQELEAASKGETLSALENQKNA